MPTPSHNSDVSIRPATQGIRPLLAAFGLIGASVLVTGAGGGEIALGALAAAVAILGLWAAAR